MSHATMDHYSGDLYLSYYFPLQVQSGITDLARFQRVVKMTAFHPFDTAENALENINAITEHEMTDDLRTFLEANLAKGKKASKFPLGVVRITHLDSSLFV